VEDETTPAAPAPLPELRAGDPRLADHIARGAPCVLRGGADGWPARGRWTPDHLRATYPDAIATVARLEGGGRLKTDARQGVVLAPMRLADFIASLERGAPAGYLMAPLDALPAELREDIEVPEPCRGAPWLSSKLWVSPGGAVSPLHFDVANNLHAQILGAKRFLLFPPGAPVYPEPLWSSVPNFSRVDPIRPDLSRFPRFRRAAPLECRLSPGDVVFIPSRYWHHVTTEEVSISVNFWWARGALAAAARAADWLKRARAISR
jgi:lysine-specific demethylase 8